jgi:hypothetical protein
MELNLFLGYKKSPLEGKIWKLILFKHTVLNIIHKMIEENPFTVGCTLDGMITNVSVPDI